MNEAQARKLETETEWNGKANVCIHCGRVPETFYIVTGHDHTDDSIRWCICRERYSQNEKHALLKENAALRAEVESLTRQRDLAVSELETIATGFDCDNDAHRYGAYCRKCEATKALAAIKESGATK
ncbi:MAG: hypothetical protein ABFC42_09120 [Sulfuricella sp.]